MADDYDDQDDRSYPMDDDADVHEEYDEGRLDFGMHIEYESDNSYDDDND